MGKTVFLFPGQGSQEVGMAGDLFRGDLSFRSLVDQASEIAGEDLARVCLKGPEKKLNNPRFLQPLLVAVSLGYLRHIAANNISADFVLGHSLGEISALAAAGVVDSAQAIAIAAKRGELMDEAAAGCSGGMMAVLSLGLDAVREIIRESGLGDKVFIANVNAPDQTVVSGDRSSFDRLSAAIVNAGGSCRKLNVTGPWHSPYLKEAQEKFRAWSKDLELKSPHTSVILNATAQPQPDPAVIKRHMTESLTQPVLFRACMDYCKAQGVDRFFEIGPGRVLSGLVRANGFMEGVAVYKVNNLQGVAGAACDRSAGAGRAAA
jgi:[acyl-carrier-protein] S-malonyltransferase